ncbi:MAG: DUF1036 domain-containing protein [Pseudonocardiaceae bacterium]
MWVAFNNSYSTVVSVAIMKRDTDGCKNDGGWATGGWWVLNPGESKTAFWTANQYAYYYAHSTDGREWSDAGGPAADVEQTQFNSCSGIGISTARSVTMNKIDVGWPPVRPFTHTVNLIR